MAQRTTRYIPALNRRWLTPAYDWVLQHLFHEQAFKTALLQEAGLDGHERVLDIGCGTATLTIALAAACPKGKIVGLALLRRKWSLGAIGSGFEAQEGRAGA